MLYIRTNMAKLLNTQGRTGRGLNVVIKYMPDDIRQIIANEIAEYRKLNPFGKISYQWVIYRLIRKSVKS